MWFEIAHDGFMVKVGLWYFLVMPVEFAVDPASILVGYLWEIICYSWHLNYIRLYFLLTILEITRFSFED